MGMIIQEKNGRGKTLELRPTSLKTPHSGVFQALGPLPYVCLHTILGMGPLQGTGLPVPFYARFSSRTANSKSSAPPAMPMRVQMRRAVSAPQAETSMPPNR